MKQYNNVPQHVAIIMDGNRRWARERGLPVNEGHRRVAFTIVRNLVEHAITRGIQYLTFWAWSTENWQRDRREVETIMRIFRQAINEEWQKLHEKGVRIRVIGDITKFAPDIRASLEELIEKTKNNRTITVIFALNYGGRDEMIRAMKKLAGSILGARKDRESLRQQFNNITIQQYSNVLDTAGIPDPDFIIRPGGEVRLSGFLLWQSEYSEFYFPRWYMPEFTPEKLDRGIEEFQKRKRRFGR